LQVFSATCSTAAIFPAAIGGAPRGGLVVFVATGFGGATIAADVISLSTFFAKIVFRKINPRKGVLRKIIAGGISTARLGITEIEFG